MKKRVFDGKIAREVSLPEDIENLSGIELLKRYHSWE
jgi:hypothetical protein